MINEDLVIDELNSLKLKRTNAGWIGVCPECNKRKMYILTNRAVHVVHCFRCPEIRMSLRKFTDKYFHAVYENHYDKIQHVDLDQRFEYRSKQRKNHQVVFSKTLEKPKECCSIKVLPDSHYAVQYIQTRQIPESMYGHIYFCDDFSKVAKVYGHEINDPNPRIILPFWGSDNNIKFIQGRSLDPDNKMRYITLRIDPTALKIWGLDRVDPDKPIYVFEGIFDACFVDNAIAMAGSNISVDELLGLFPGKKPEDFIFVYDNDQDLEAKRVIDKEIEAKIDLGCSILLWPFGLVQKDLNDMIINRSFDINRIDEFVFHGMTAKIRFIMQKRLN